MQPHSSAAVSAPKLSGPPLLTAAEIVHALGGRSGVARCPAHDDHTPSLSVSDRDGRVLVHCHAGCDQRAVLDALAERGLWPASMATPKSPAAVSAPKLPGAPDGHAKRRSKPPAVHTYRDEDGTPWLNVYRHEKPDGGKAFSQCDLKAGKWIEKNGHRLPDRRPLYRLDTFARRPAGSIVLVEGEKCADALTKLGIDATTTLGGAGGINKADFRPLRGWRVLIWPDADQPGRKYAETAATMLLQVGAEPLIIPIPKGQAAGWDVADAIRDGWTVEEIRAQLDMAEPVESLQSAEPAQRFQLLTDDDLERQPDKPDLVKGVFPAAAFIVLAGPPAVAKTTLGQELAGGVACGLTFHGRSVTAGPVVVIAAEGASKLGLRVRAWKMWRKVSGPSGVYYITEPVRFDQAGDVEALLSAIGKLPNPPVLIVVDTLARCMVGADENSARDVGAFIQGCDRVRQTTGAAVLVIHHTTKSGNAERGSGALRGAADTLAIISREDDLVTVACEKQKDLPPFEPLHFRLRVVELGNERTACVLDPIASPIRQTKGQAPETLPESRRKVLDALGDAVDGATFSQWLRLAQETFRVSESTFTRAVKDLITWERVARRGERYFAKKDVQS